MRSIKNLSIIVNYVLDESLFEFLTFIIQNSALAL